MLSSTMVMIETFSNDLSVQTKGCVNEWKFVNVSENTRELVGESDCVS